MKKNLLLVAVLCVGCLAWAVKPADKAWLDFIDGKFRNGDYMSCYYPPDTADMIPIYFLILDNQQKILDQNKEILKKIDELEKKLIPKPLGLQCDGKTTTTMNVTIIRTADTSPPKVDWLGFPAVYNPWGAGIKYGCDESYRIDVKIGLRDDGVVVWRKWQH